MKQIYMSPLVTVLQITQSDIMTTSTENPKGFIEGDIKDFIWE